MLIVGLNGPIDAGKSTLAKEYIDKSGLNVERYSFAIPIKQAFANFYPVGTMVVWYKTTVAPAMGGKTVREMYQLLGTEFGRRMISESIWIDLAEVWLDYLCGLLPDLDVVIIDDVRFHNEASWIRSKEGIVVRVPAWSTEPQEECLHQSETESAMIAPDYTIKSTDMQIRFDELNYIISKRLG